ncbi:MAG: hypothetical protein KDC66_07750 [Phaeodactylibacter sp.]|nr:hypothetical protein [Phaeodactylibacter sp.]MCB9274813.1 hypothetical protein [Lewinellaceae bacterium]
MSRALVLVFLFPLLFAACFERAPGPPPPGSDEVLEVEDSIRGEILLRISFARMEINRQTEMMRRRAYNADAKTARRLNRRIAEAEAAYLELEHKSALLASDSLPSNWLELKQQTDILLESTARLLQTPL